MAVKEVNDVVDEYLKTKPHWIIRNGLTTIIGLILIGALITSNIDTQQSEFFQIKLTQEDTLVYEINPGSKVYLTERFVEEGIQIRENDTLISFITPPDYQNLLAYSKSLEAVSNTAQEQILFNEYIDLKTRFLISPVSGKVYYSDDQSHSIFILSYKLNHNGTSKSSNALKGALLKPDNTEFNLVGKPGQVNGSIEILSYELSDENVLLSFSLSRTLSLSEGTNSMLTIELVRNINLLKSIIEQL